MNNKRVLLTFSILCMTCFSFQDGANAEQRISVSKKSPSPLNEMIDNPLEKYQESLLSKPIEKKSFADSINLHPKGAKTKRADDKSNDPDERLKWNITKGTLEQNVFHFPSKDAIPYSFNLPLTIEGTVENSTLLSADNRLFGSVDVFAETATDKDGSSYNRLANTMEFKHSFLPDTDDWSLEQNVTILGDSTDESDVPFRKLLHYGKNTLFVSVGMGVLQDKHKFYVQNPSGPNVDAFLKRNGKYYLDADDYSDKDKKLYEHALYENSAYYNSEMGKLPIRDWVHEKQHIEKENLILSNTWSLCKDCSDSEKTNNPSLESPRELLLMPFTVYVDGTENELVVSPDVSTVKKGETTAFKAELLTKRYKKGKPAETIKSDVTNFVNWTVEETLVADKYAAGNFGGRTIGESKINVSFTDENGELHEQNVLFKVAEDKEVAEAKSKSELAATPKLVDTPKINTKVKKIGKCQDGECSPSVMNINARGGRNTFSLVNDLVFTSQSSSGKINPVTVHTPVVMYPRSTDDKAHDQRTEPPERSEPPNPDEDRHAYVLDRPFTVSLPTKGQHLDVADAPGYGDRDYAKYVREKQVRFPFDVYTETKQAFYPKDTWINVPVEMEDVTFFLPVWVPEGEYTVKYRAFAINANEPSQVLEERKANLNKEYRTPATWASADGIMENHIAFNTIEVDVVGRLFDFRVTDIMDFRWESVFRRTKGGPTHSGNYYWVGDKGIDGDVRGNLPPFNLPIRHGSHADGYPDGMKNVAVKTGYHFKFDMKTKGDMFETSDAIRIKPSFYFVNKDGKSRKPVDIYYHDKSHYFVKIGSEKDKQYREVVLNAPLRNVSDKQIFDTAEYLYRHPQGKYHELTPIMSEQMFIRNFTRKYSKQSQVVGSYGWQMLNRNLRTFTGPDREDVPDGTMVPKEDIKSREQMWYAEYSLPADIYVVEKDKDVSRFGNEYRMNKDSSIFLQDGYVIVNFDIETITDGNTEKPRLQYINSPLNNQWAMEGFKYNFIDGYNNKFDLIDGDVIFYHGDQSSYGDFGTRVTH